MKVLTFTLILAMILPMSETWSAEGKIKLENKLSVGDRIVSESTEENYTWANFKQMGGPLFEQTGTMEITITVDVISLDKDGVFDLKVASEISGTTEYSDQAKATFIPATKQAARIIRVAKNGQVISPDIGQYELNHPRNPLLDIDNWLVYVVKQQSPPLIRLPDREVGVGDVWITETPVKTPDGGELKIITHAGLFAFGKMDEYECAWIQSEARLPFKFKLSGDFEGYSSITVDGMLIWEGRSYFAYGEGRMIKERNSWSFVVAIDMPLKEQNAKGFYATRVNTITKTSLSRSTD